MLNSASPATASIHTATASAAPTSPTRPSRLRGLSYLRTYTQNHLASYSSRPDTSLLTRSTSSPSVVNLPPSGGTRRPNTGERGSQQQREQQQQQQQSNSASRIENGGNGWIPTIQGRSGLSRESLYPTTTSPASASPEPSSTAAMMTRSRAANPLGPTPANTLHTHSSQRRPSAAQSPTSPTYGQPSMASPPATGTNKDKLPSIRFIPHVETRSSRPSLPFDSMSRTLKHSNSVVRVGRYSERDGAPTDPNTLPVGFKSKVVSRRHCEFWCTDGQWYIKDVKSSSGTFLNHVRLSSPGVESRPYPVNDGDVVQLGIDFKGGEEVIFRCVKIRVECNRGWQKSLNSFNTSAHKRLLRSAVNAKTKDSDAGSVSSSECSICLNPVAPCQALFVAPCSHVWHYKCIRNLIHSPNWPNFLCPNCRYMSDLEADVEQPDDEYFEPDTAAEQSKLQSSPLAERSGSSDDNSVVNHGDDTDEDRNAGSTPRIVGISRHQEVDDDLAALLNQTALGTPSPAVEVRRPSGYPEPQTPSSTQPIAILQPSLSARNTSDPIGARSVTPTSHAQFALAAGSITTGPRTPRNDAGPFILDGHARRDMSEETITEHNEPAASTERTGR